MQTLFSAFCIGGLILTSFFPFVSYPVSAADTLYLQNETEELNESLKAKRQRVQDLRGLINRYSGRIKEQESQRTTLENELVLLDSRIREKELRIEESEARIDLLKAEIDTLDLYIKKESERIEAQKLLLGDLLRRIRQADDVQTLHVFLTRPSLSSYFNQIEALETLEGDLSHSLQRVLAKKEELLLNQQDLEQKREALDAQRIQLVEETERLAQERGSKTSLLAATNSKQEEFARVLDELRQQQESTVDTIANLEAELKDKLNELDQALASGQTLLLWPVPLRKITAKFHDPEYPFRHLYEHPGIDLRADQGTPLKAAGGGYVAWTKQGRAYGNYIMVIHPGNLATIYAHLSSFNVKPGTYVERGQVIGFTGGMPGTSGAGLSTGPHLHFEVRKGGIPVDPQGYLPVLRELDP